MLNRVCLILIGTITIACARSSEAKGLGQTCKNKLKGTWDYGQAPHGCVVSDEIAEPLENKYKLLTFDESKSKTSEKPRFTSEMYDYLTDYAEAYIKRRNPSATSADVDGWTQLVLAMVQQESYWTQYRFGKDSIFRVFRGDGGHGYGLGQIDDRWHKKFILSNKVYDINANLTYALDMLYDMRSKSLKKPCSGKKDVESINRSAYSAYNGGPGSKCRWLKSSKWAANDKGFLQKYRARSWEVAMQGSDK